MTISEMIGIVRDIALCLAIVKYMLTVKRGLL